MQKTEYAFDRTANKCYTYSLSDTFPSYQIPSNATAENPIVVGNSYVDVYKWTDANNNQVISGASDDCVLVFRDQFTPSGDVVKVFIWNFIPSVSPYSFDIPSVCETTRLRATPELNAKIRKLF